MPAHGPARFEVFPDTEEGWRLRIVGSKGQDPGGTRYTGPEEAERACRTLTDAVTAATFPVAGSNNYGLHIERVEG